MLDRLLAHNDWANERLLEACAELTDEQLDATPWPGQWSIRENLAHMVEAQRGYLALLTLPLDQREGPALAFDQLAESARASGAALLDLVRGDAPTGTLRTTDGYRVEPWVVVVQVVNHGAEHRKQVAGLLRALGLAAPWMDGWAFGEATGALVRVE